MWKTNIKTSENPKDQIGNEESKQLSSIKNETSELSGLGNFVKKINIRRSKKQWNGYAFQAI